MMRLSTKQHPNAISNKGRDSNIELYRIISMILIIAHHYVVNSGMMTPIYKTPLSYTSIFLLLFGAWGKIGINCFVLITGYFMCKSQITLKKFVKLLFEVLFYRTLFYCIFWITGYASFNIKDFIKLVLPVTSIGTNFTETYLTFFLFIPFLNVLIKNLNEKQHIRLLLLASFVYIVCGTLPLFYVTMNYVSWYIVLYLIASYIRLYPKKIFNNTAFWSIATILSILLSCFSVVAATWLGTKTGENISYDYVTDSNTFLAVLTGLCSFMMFKNLKIKYNKFINTVSATTFGILLIHSHSSTMRQWLWKDVLHNAEMYSSKYLVLHAIASVIVVFIVCSLLDMLRIKFIEAPAFRLWDKYLEKPIVQKFKAIEDKICKKLNVHQDN